MDSIHLLTATARDLRKLPNVGDVTAKKIVELREKETLTYHNLAAISKIPQNRWEAWSQEGRVTLDEPTYTETDQEMDANGGRDTDGMDNGDGEEPTVTSGMLSQASRVTDDTDQSEYLGRPEDDSPTNANDSATSNGITNEELRHRTMEQCNNMEVRMTKMEEESQQWRVDFKAQITDWFRKRNENISEQIRKGLEEHTNAFADLCYTQVNSRTEHRFSAMEEKLESRITDLEGKMDYHLNNTHQEIGKLADAVEDLKGQLYRGLGDIQGVMDKKCDQVYQDFDLKLSEHQRQYKLLGKPHSDDSLLPHTWRQSSAEESEDNSDTESPTSAKATINKSYRELGLGMGTLDISRSPAKDDPTTKAGSLSTKATNPGDQEVETPAPPQQSTGLTGAKVTDSPLPPSQRGTPVEFRKITNHLPVDLVYHTGQQPSTEAVGNRTPGKEKAGNSREGKRNAPKLNGQKRETSNKAPQACGSRPKLQKWGPNLNISEGEVSSLVWDDTIAGTALVGGAAEERRSKPALHSGPSGGMRNTPLDIVPDKHRSHHRKSGPPKETLQFQYKGSPNPPENQGMRGSRTEAGKGSPNLPENPVVRGNRTDRRARDTPYQGGKEKYQLVYGTGGQVYQQQVRQPDQMGHASDPDAFHSAGYDYYPPKSHDPYSYPATQYPSHPPPGYGDVSAMQRMRQPPEQTSASVPYDTRHESGGHFIHPASLPPGGGQMSAIAHPGFATGNPGGYPQVHEGAPYQSVPGHSQARHSLTRTPLRPPTVTNQRPSARRLKYPEDRPDESETSSDSSESEYSSNGRRSHQRRSKSGSSSGRTERARLPAPKMPRFSGAVGEWDDFLFQFENICGYYRMGKGDKLQQLKSSLSGNAVRFVRTLSERCTSSYRRLCSRLRDRFAGTERPEVLRNTIPDLKQRVDESVDEFADRIQTQTNLAFPEYPPEYIDWSAKNSFIRGARDRPAVLEAVKTNPQTIRQLINAMKDHSALVKAIMGKSSHSAMRQVSFIEEEPVIRHTSARRQHAAPSSPPPRTPSMETKGTQAGASSGGDRYRFPSNYKRSPTREYPSDRSPSSSPGRRNRPSHDRCFNCDQPGHFRAACPQGASSPKANGRQ